MLFGSLVGGMLHALTSRTELDMPPLLFRVGQALVGAVIGALVELPTLVRIASDWPSVLLVTVGHAGDQRRGRTAAGPARRDVSPATGAFALIAGGASGIVALARELGADDRVVTIVQYLRVLLVLLAMPLVTDVRVPPARRGGGTLPTGPTRWLPDLIFVVVAVGVGLLLQRVVRAHRRRRCWVRCWSRWRCPPAGSWARRGADRAGAARLRADRRPGRAAVHPRQPAEHRPAAAAGHRADRAGHRGLRPARAAAVARSPGVDRLTAYLATTPGGLFAVLATAADSGSDVTYVLAVQVIRVFAMLLVAPLLARRLRR